MTPSSSTRAPKLAADGACCPVPSDLSHRQVAVLSGAPDCRATWRLSTPEELLQHASVGVVLVIVADQKPSHRGPATCATPVAAAVHS